jgi:hypothetical protein
MTGLSITSSSEWLNLPEPTLPSVRDPADEGSIYHVHHVGFFIIPDHEFNYAPERVKKFGDKKYLITSVIDFEGEKVLCKLPEDLTPWVADCVAWVYFIKGLFPCPVEFGRLNGKAYATIR